MSEYLRMEKPFLDQLAALGWEVVDQCNLSDGNVSRHQSFCLLLHPSVAPEEIAPVVSS